MEGIEFKVGDRVKLSFADRGLGIIKEVSDSCATIASDNGRLLMARIGASEFYASDDVSPYTIKAKDFAMDWQAVSTYDKTHVIVREVKDEGDGRVLLYTKEPRRNGKGFFYFNFDSEIEVVPRCNQAIAQGLLTREAIARSLISG